MAIDWDKLEANAKAKDRKHYEEGKRANAVLFQTHTSGGTSTPVTSLPLTQSMSFQRDLGVLSLGANPAMGALNTTVNKLTDTPQLLPSLPSRQTYAGQSYDQIQADIDRLNQDREQTKQLQTALRQQMAGQSRGWTGAKSNEQLQAELGQLDTHLKSIDASLKVASTAANQAMWREYSAIPSRPDYAQYAAQGAAIQNPSQREAEGMANLFGWRPGAQDVGNIVTYSRDNWESIALGEMGGSQMVGRSLYHYMTDDEVGIYNYLLAKEGKEAAQEYLDGMEETLNARFGYQQGENIRGIENPVGRALTTGAYGFGAGIEQFGSGIKQLGSSERLPTSPSQFASSYIREDLAKEGNTLGGIGYDLVNTAGNMAPSILLSALTGGLGAPAAAAQGVGAATLGASAGGNAYNQALAEGYNEEQARNYGVLTAASEGALQYLLGGIGALGGKLTGRAAQATIQNIDNALLRTAADLGFSMAGEGTEEYLQTVLEPVYRNLIFNENNEVKLVSEEAAYSFLLGALSAGLMEGGGRLAGNTAALMQTRAQNRPGAVAGRVNEGLSQAGRVETAGTAPRGATYLPTAEETLGQTYPAAPQAARQTQVETPPAAEQTAPVALPVPESSPSPLPEQTPGEIAQRVEIPIQERTWSDVGSRKIHAFQYDHPELRPYYQQAAREFQGELSSSVRGERFPLLDADGAIVGYAGTKRSASEPVEQARDNAGLSYAQIEKALEDLIADNGQENYAAAKKVELILDDMLSNGYTDSTGRFIPPDEAYIAARDRVNAGQDPGNSEYRMSEEEWASLLGQEGPPVPERSVELLPDPGAEATGPAQNRGTGGREPGAYRAQIPQNVDMPTVPIINLSMQSVADLNGGRLPQTGNALRKEAITRARRRLGLDENSAIYIPASNVTRNGEEYVLKITRASLNKMLSPTERGKVAPESIAVLDNLERIANNGVYFKSEGDRKGRDQIAGYDHLMTTVYIDNQPYTVDMRVRVYDEQSGGGNTLYYFTPEEIITTRKVEVNPPTVGRHATNISSEGTSTSVPIIPDTTSQNNPQSPPVGPESSVGAARAGFDPYTHLQGQYGTIPPGEQPARTVDVPARTAPHNRVSRTARTVMEAAATPDAALPEIGQMVVDGRLSYLPVRNDQRTVMAENRIRKAGYQDALANWTSDVRSGKSSADLVATGAQLYNAAVNAGDTAQALDILYDYTKLIRSSAQATQAARILKKLTPSGTLYMIQKEVNNLNDTTSKRKTRRAADAADNVPVELWMQRVGENLADHLAQRVNAPREQIQTVSQTILSDLRRYANETAPKENRKKNKRTEMDRITDLFQNRTAYEEAWGAAKDTLSDTFENNPQALAAFEDWLEQSLDYTRALTKELTGQNEIIIPQDLADAYLSAETDQAREQALGDIYQSIADQMPADWKMKWNAWRYLAMLANPRTHIRNIVGNVGFQPLRVAKDRVAAAIEAGVSKATGGKIERTKSFAANPALYQAAWNDWANVRDALSGSKYNDASSQIESRRQVFSLPLLEGARKGNSALLELEDAVFKRLTYTDALAGYLQANGVSAQALSDGTADTDLLSRARDYAGQEALKATYQDRNAVSDFLSSRYRGKGAGVINAATDAILPFRRTPANILVRGLEYSPAGLAKALTYDLAKVKGGELSAAQAIDHIAAGLTGSGLMALGAYLFAQGLVSSGGGDDEGQDAINDLTGGQNYALNLPGGGSVTLDWLAPEALPFFMGVELMESMGQSGSTADSILNALKSVSEPMLELSMLQSLNDAIESVSFSENKLGALASSALVSYFSQAIPTIGGQIERTAEDRRMTTYTDKNFPLPTDLQYALGRASSRIPGWDYQQVPYIDAWGREEGTGTLPMRAFDNFLNPAYTSSLNVTPVDAEIQRLYSQTGDGGVVPERPGRYITVDGVREDLSSQAYTRYATQRGQTQYALLEGLLQSQLYQGLSDTDKAAVVGEIYDYADAVAKAAVSAYEPEGWIAKAVDSGADPAGYILYRHSLSGSGLALTDRVQAMEEAGITGDAQTQLLLLDNPDWAEAAREAGVSEALFADFKVATAGISSDRDREGNTISGSKKEKVLAAIDGMGISRREKDALYYAAGYRESTIHEAPWH